VPHLHYVLTKVTDTPGGGNEDFRVNILKSDAFSSGKGYRGPLAQRCQMMVKWKYFDSSIIGLIIINS